MKRDKRTTHRLLAATLIGALSANTVEAATRCKNHEHVADTCAPGPCRKAGVDARADANPRLAAGAIAVAAPASRGVQGEQDEQASQADTQEVSTLEERLPDLINDLFIMDEELAADARYALLLAELDHDALVAITAAADGPEQLAVAQDIARHHVLTRLRHEELADLEDDTVIVGFRFQPSATAGNVGPLVDDELIERFPYGALVSATTAGFPGYAYLRPFDMIVRIDGDPLPEDRLAAQQHVMDAVRAHTPDETIDLAVIRGGELVELDVPLARAAALPRMYDARTITRDLIDPFLFLWEEAWGTIKLDAGYDEDAD